MPRVAITLETAALVRAGLPIVAVATYDIEREIDAAGSWALEFPADEALASQVRSRWRVSITEEGRAGYLLYRGIVTDRQFSTARDGGGMLRLAGFTRLFALTNQSTRQGLRFAGDASILQIATALAGEPVTAPTIPDAATRRPIVTFNDTTRLSALLSALEYARVSVRETFNQDSFELTAWDNVPDSGFRFVTVEQAGPELEGAAANGVGLIAGTPRIGYNGRDLATRVIPVGTDFDGNPLTLAASTMSVPYPIQVGSNPDGSSYRYLQDNNAVAATELVELHMVRSDIKNPNNDSGSRTQAANALYAVAAGTLIQRKSDVIAFSSEIANGAQIDALPGSRVRIQFRGRAASFGGGGNYWSLDQWFLINKRRDFASTAGVRGVSFTLTAPEVPLAVPSLPNEIVIPPPASSPPSPPSRDTGFGNQEGQESDKGGGDEAALDVPPLEDPAFATAPDFPDMGPIPKSPIPPKKLVPPERDRGAYQPCCPDPTTINEGGDHPPPDVRITSDGNVRDAWRNTIVTSSGSIDYQNVEDGPMRFFAATSAPVVVTSDDSWAVIATNGTMSIYRGPALEPGSTGHSLTWPPFGASVRMCALRVDQSPSLVMIQAYERPFGFGPGFAAQLGSGSEYEPISPDGDPVYATTPSILPANIVP